MGNASRPAPPGTAGLRGGSAASRGPDRNITENRRARHEYHILETLEAGIQLTGTEMKSIRKGHISMVDSFARLEGSEVWLHNMHIAPYELGNRYNHDPLRPRKLLLHREEIRRLVGTLAQKGLTLVPLRMYWSGNWAKVQLGLAKGKLLHDKREALQSKEAKREVERALKAQVRG